MSALRRQSKGKSLQIEQSIGRVLREVPPLLRIEHCTIELAEFSRASGVLELRIEGSCPDCDMSPALFLKAIEAHLKLRVPEVTEVRLARSA